MYNTLIRNIIRFVALVIMQVLVFDNIGFGNYIHPTIYVLFMLILPFDFSKVRLLIRMAVDIFSGTPGLNAAATVFLAFLRPYVIKLTTRQSDLEGKNCPTVSEMGLQWFSVYAILLLLLHNLVYFWLEAFSIKLLGLILIETLLSSIASLLILLLTIYLFKPIKK